jgi:hypothetical protein
LIASGQSFELAKIEAARLDRVRLGLLARLRGQKPVFRLLVRPRGNSVPVVALETQDREFVQRIESAMDKAARANKGAQRAL